MDKSKESENEAHAKTEVSAPPAIGVGELGTGWTADQDVALRKIGRIEFQYVRLKYLDLRMVLP